MQLLLIQGWLYMINKLDRKVCPQMLCLYRIFILFFFSPLKLWDEMLHAQCNRKYVCVFLILHQFTCLHLHRIYDRIFYEYVGTVESRAPTLHIQKRFGNFYVLKSFAAHSFAVSRATSTENWTFSSCNVEKLKVRGHLKQLLLWSVIFKTVYSYHFVLY